jgi:hypothetical protein
MNIYLGTFSSFKYDEIKQHIIDIYKAEESELNKYIFLIAYETILQQDGLFYFLLKNKDNNKYYEAWGFCEDEVSLAMQFVPQEIKIEHLKSQTFSLFGNGKYDPDLMENRQKILTLISNLK